MFNVYWCNNRTMIKLTASLIALSLCSYSSYKPMNDLHSNDEPVTEIEKYVQCEQLYEECWNELPQTIFWKKIMQLTEDSIILNVAATREILEIVSIADWNKFSDDEKEIYRVNQRLAFGLDKDERIFATTGKKDFYKFNEVIPQLKKGIEVFEENSVDPWYAQSILLIECPGQMKKSNAGAYGAFQLMPSVARSHGLIVNREIDERKDFGKAAKAASEVIQEVCIPETKKLLAKYNIKAEPKKLWFRLLVLHVYHAGAFNVDAVIQKINPTKGSQELIQALWQNKAASFGNSSQNYSQLALAANVILREMIEESLSNETESNL